MSIGFPPERPVLARLPLALALVVAVGVVLACSLSGCSRANQEAKPAATTVAPQTGSPPGGIETIPGRAITKGKEVDCRSRLQSIRSAIEMQRSMQETPPASLGQINVGTSDPDYLKCPVGGESYTYDPRSGTVRCPHPGHQNF